MTPRLESMVCFKARLVSMRSSICREAASRYEDDCSKRANLATRRSDSRSGVDQIVAEGEPLGAIDMKLRRS